MDPRISVVPTHHESVRRVFDETADEYDRLDDLYYAWLYCRLHAFLAESLWALRETLERVPRRALDAGCGTGFQSFLLAEAGYEVDGVDLSPGLIRVADAKRERGDAALLPPVPFGFRTRHAASIAKHLSEVRQKRERGAVHFRVDDLTTVQLPAAAYGVVVCCGSTLSFVDDYREVLRRARTALAPGGLLLVEVENRLNADLLWALADSLLLRGRAYGQSLRKSVEVLLAGGHARIDYVVSATSGDIVYPLRLFDPSTFARELRAIGFTPVRECAIHAVTNLVPSVALHRAGPGPVLRALFAAAARVEERVACAPLLRRLGCSWAIAALRD